MFWFNRLPALLRVSTVGPCRIIDIFVLPLLYSKKLIAQNKALLVCALGKHFDRVFTCKKLQDQINQTLQSSEPFYMLEKVNNVEVIIHCVPVTSGGNKGMLIIFEDQTEKNARLKAVVPWARDMR